MAESPPKLKIAGIYVIWNKKVLIHKRSDKAGSEASWHKFASPGGKVDPEDNGSFRTAALRELKEETGLTAKPGSLRVLKKESSTGADSVMYYVKYMDKPTVTGPDEASMKSFDMDFDFAKKGVKGEVAGAGYYWADLSSILSYLNEHPKYKNPYFVKNIQQLKKVASGTRKV
jgi:8-oxo-dGTP pyrophosphatase MutT (NUDIX family)